MTERILLEIAPKRAFASALEWPGWARSGRTEADAIASLVAHADRYASVVERSGLRFMAPADAAALEIVETLTGNGTTEFGAPGAISPLEAGSLDAEVLERLVSLLVASWDTFDAAVAAAAGHRLTTGPRGGGRDLGKIVSHVADAESSYLGMLGSRGPLDRTDDETATSAARDAFVETVRAVAAGAPPPNPRRTRNPWPPRYAVRRAAWHVLDHAWEIENRAGLTPDDLPRSQ